MAFQPARYCLEYPVLSYLLVLRLEQTGVFINISLGANETEVMLGPQDGLGKKQKYVFTVTAVSSSGTTTSHQAGDDECLCKYIGQY